MVCLGLEPGAAGWKAQTNPLSYGGTPINYVVEYNSHYVQSDYTCNLGPTKNFILKATQP